MCSRFNVDRGTCTPGRLKAKRPVESFCRTFWVWPMSHLAKSVSFRSFACSGHGPHFLSHSPLSKDSFQPVYYLTLSVLASGHSRLNGGYHSHRETGPGLACSSTPSLIPRIS